MGGIGQNILREYYEEMGIKSSKNYPKLLIIGPARHGLVTF